MLQIAGIDLRQCGRTLRNVPGFWRDYRTFQRLPARFPLPMGRLYPCLHDKTDTAGTIGGHYLHQDLWAAQHIFHAAPARHVDVGSRIDGFITHLLVFRQVEVIDIRPLPHDVPGLTFVQDDATTLARFSDNSIESLSCLHAAEHFGLGRYGDPLDPDGPFKLMDSLKRVLSPGGTLYFAVPCGVERIEFNAHRVFDPQRIIAAFAPLRCVEISAVHDDGRLYPDADIAVLARQQMGLGLFCFVKA